MNEDGATHKALITLIARGVELGAQRLGRLSCSTWNIDAVSLSAGTAPDDLLGVSAKDHFGTFLAIPGGGFLLVFPPKSGFLVTNRFTLSSAEPVDALADRESQVLAEVSNIIINALTDVMAEACGKTLLLSSPQTLKSRKQDILRLAREKFPAAGNPAWTCHARLKTPTFSSDCDLLVFLDAELFSLLRGGGA